MKKTTAQIEAAAAINSTRKAIGKRWFALAVAWSTNEPNSKQERQAAIRALHPSHATKAKAKNIGSLAVALETVEKAAQAIRSARRLRRIIKTENKEYYLPASLFAPAKKTESLETRLNNRIRKLAAETLYRSTNTPARDDIRVRITTNPAELGLSTVADTCRPYRGSYKTWTANEYTRTVTVPRRYISMVYSEGLAIVGGMMTLDAAPVDSPERGITVYAATWLQESRGYECKTIKGFIAIDGIGNNFHGKSVKSAIAGLHNKTAAPEVKASRSAKYFEGRLKRALEVCADRKFSFTDAKRLGFCEFGIKSWCHRVGIDPDGTACIKQIVDGYKTAPLTEVRQFILHYCR